MVTSNNGRHLAVIPARGGSKRLPRKNVIDFLGKPIIHYTIEAAHAARIFDRVLVSTEDAEIAAIAKRAGAEIDPRPAALATDDATIAQLCLELLDRLERSGEQYETLSVLYATAPLRVADDVRATWQLLSPRRCDFAMAITEFQQPVHQALQTDGKILNPVFPDSVRRRTSSMGAYYAGNGSTYSVNVAAFQKNPSFYGTPLCGHVMPIQRSIDINTIEDLRLAQFYGEQKFT